MSLAEESFKGASIRIEEIKAAYSRMQGVPGEVLSLQILISDGLKEWPLLQEYHTGILTPAIFADILCGMADMIRKGPPK